MLIDRQIANGAFPWGTFAVNMIGCLLFGLVYAAMEERVGFSAEMRGIVLTGFMGAFTTYSSFAFQSAQLIERSHWGLAAANIISQNVLGVVFVFAGFAIGRMLHA